MASSSLSSLLGLAPPPVIAPSAVEKRLSKAELRVATAVFHRARGYGDRIDFPRLRDTVLHEAFGAMPLYVMQRLFMVWNFAGGASTSGALTLKEFLVGVTTAWKGSRDEHLKFAFQLMDRHGSQELTKRDAVAFLRAVAGRGGVVAVEAPPSGKTWTVDEFADMLFAHDKAVLTPGKFVKVVTSRSFEVLAIVDWMPMLAAQFERETEKLVAAVTPVSTSTTGYEESTDGLMETIMIKLRRISSDDKTATSSSAPMQPPKTMKGARRTNEDQPERDIIQIEPATGTQIQQLKSVLAEMVRRVLSTKVVISHRDVREHFSGVVSATVLDAIQATADACAGDFLLCDSPSLEGDALIRSQSKATAVWWILCICCSFARSSAEVFRYLFVLFDDESLGYWTRTQLTSFIRCADYREEEVSSEEQAAFLAQTVLDEMAATSRSATQHDDPLVADTPMFRYRDFEKYLARYPISGCSAADIDIVFILLHTNLSKHRGQHQSHRAYLDALHYFCDQLIAHEVTTQLGFCLIRRSTWERLVDWICDYDNELGLTKILKNELCTLVETCDVPQEMNSDDAFHQGYDLELLSAVPISLWLVLAMKLLERTARPSCVSWVELASHLNISTPTRDGHMNGQEVHDDAWSLDAVVASITLAIAARDGSELVIDIPHCILDREVTLQSLVQATINLHGRERPSARIGASFLSTHPKGAFFCEGDIEFLRASEQSRKVQVSQGILLIPLSTLDESTNCRRIRVTLNVLLTDGRSNSNLPRWQTPMLASPASSQRSGASTPSSRTPRNSKRGAASGWTKVHGLANLGNTCFMNSALQCLAATPVLREYFLRGEHLLDLSSHAVVPAPETNFVPKKKTSPKSVAVVQLPKSSLLPIAFGQLLAEMNAYSSNGSVSGMADVISPKYMKAAIATLFPHLSDGSQQDAQEFLSSLLNCLSEELKRLPIPATPNGQYSDAQTNSSSLMSRFTSFSRGNPSMTITQRPSSESELSKFRFQVNDSNGRHDSTVAKEWWISHLISEPSVITALFSGQFKSTLQCTQCGNTSTRFEPFSSLQLPLMDEAAMLSPRSKTQHQHVVVVLHFMDSPCHRPSLRLVVQAGLDWTIEQLLIRIQQDHATYSTSNVRRDHIAVSLSGFTVDDYIDPDALVSSVATPINVFEIEFGDQARAFDKTLSPRTNADVFETGTKVLARASHERWVKAVIERPGLPAPTPSESQSPTSSIPLTYHLCIEEAGLGTRVCLGRSDIRPRSSERFMLLRFLHRRPTLVPFYSTSPYRQVICGFPFVCRLPSSHISGRGLYHMVHRRFASVGLPTTSGEQHSFVLKRVGSDGKSCGHCHWTDHCDGCKIDRSGEDPLDLEMDETIAIDWTLDVHEHGEDWLTIGCSIDDHTSYVAYKLDNTHSLEKSLQILCSEERVDARCSRCSSKSATKSDQSPRSDDSVANGRASHATSNSLIPHTKTLGIWSLPPILVIQLKRFELVADGGYSWRRLNHSVDFQVEDFDMASFLASTDGSTASCTSDTNDREEVSRAESFLSKELQFPTDTASRDVSSYRLYGLVNHMGDLGGGHYTAHIRHPDNADWWLVDDASATPSNPQTLSPSSSAYLLFYVREDLDPTGGDDDDDDLDRELSTRPRGLSDFYPRQPHATPVPDAAVRTLCKQDSWRRLPSSSKQDSKRDDSNCNVM